MSIFLGRAVRATGLLFGLLGCAGANLLGHAADASGSVPRGPVAPSTAAVATENVPITDAKNAEDLDALPNAPAAAQRSAEAAKAETPSPAAAQPTAADSAGDEKQTKRILYMLPNFRSVDSNVVLPPQTAGQKFKTATMDSLDYSSFIFYGLQSGIALASKSYPEFHSGFPGYGRYYWHTAVDSTSENYWVEFILPSALHEDIRYYTLGDGSFPRRFAYAFTRIVVTRSDGGGETVNFSEIVGAGAAAGMSNLYYPSQERTFTKTYQRWVTNVLIDGGVFVIKEFWPDINSRLVHEQN